MTRPFFFDLIDHATDQVNGYGEADALGALASCDQHSGIDADEFAHGCIDQRAAGVAGILIAAIGLNEVLERCEIQQPPTGSADDPLGDRLCQAVGVANGEHHIADTKPAERSAPA